MIKQNQAYLNRLHIFIDAVCIYLSAFLSHKIRFEWGKDSWVSKLFSLSENMNWDFHTTRRRFLLQSLSFFYYMPFSAYIPPKGISAEAVRS